MQNTNANEKKDSGENLSWAALVCVSERVSQLGKCNCLLITYRGFFSDCNDNH